MNSNIYNLERYMQTETTRRQGQATQRRRGQLARQTLRLRGTRTLLRAGRLVIGWQSR
ncbi:MAG TPA: hypothetical protein VKY74_13055 [Chloroflexia bacterium]|nr:hypothetical protein [Chloroflexia bacterium]